MAAAYEHDDAERFLVRLERLQQMPNHKTAKDGFACARRASNKTISGGGTGGLKMCSKTHIFSPILNTSKGKIISKKPFWGGLIFFLDPDYKEGGF